MNTTSEVILGVDLALREVNTLIGEREIDDNRLQSLHKTKAILLDVRYSLCRIMKVSGSASKLSVRDKLEISALIAAIFKAAEFYL